MAASGTFLQEIRFEGLLSNEVSLVWDWEELPGYNDGGDSRSYGIVREGDAALQVDATGDSIFFGTLAWWDIDTSTGVEGNDFSFGLAFDDVTVTTREAFNNLFNLSSVGASALPDTFQSAPDDFQAARAAGEDIDGTAGDDNLTGTAGNDTIDGGAGNDTLSGGAGDDAINGDAGDDTILGEDGDDILAGGAGADTLTGGAGIDTVSYAASAGAVIVNLDNGAGTGGDAEGDQLSGAENILGSTHNDTLTGDAGANVLEGGAGRDILSGGAENDTLIGGAANDTYFIHDAGDVVVEQAGEGYDTIKTFASYTLSDSASIESFQLSGSADIDGTGNADDNVIVGNRGANLLDGGAGDDILGGDRGNDALTGGLGADEFVFSQLTGTDSITDFTSGTDVIDVSAFGFADFNAVIAASSQAGSDTVIDLDFTAGDQAVLIGVALQDLDEADFQLIA